MYFELPKTSIIRQRTILNIGKNSNTSTNYGLKSLNRLGINQQYCLLKLGKDVPTPNCFSQRLLCRSWSVCKTLLWNSIQSMRKRSTKHCKEWIIFLGSLYGKLKPFLTYSKVSDWVWSTNWDWLELGFHMGTMEFSFYMYVHAHALFLYYITYDPLHFHKQQFINMKS